MPCPHGCNKKSKKRKKGFITALNAETAAKARAKKVNIKDYVAEAKKQISK